MGQMSSKTDSHGFLIAAFNVQVFGHKKAHDEEILNILADVVPRYDIILILEVRDSTNTAIQALLDAVNKKGPRKYGQATSVRLGRTKSKEQYAFLYRVDDGCLKVLDTYQYPDKNEEFEREPFAVRFSSSRTALKEFTLVAIHTDPDDAVAEMIALEKVFSDVTSRWKDDNVLVMGDYNAEGSYASKKALNNLEIRKNPKYKWFISDEIDTTAGPSDCAYDRFVMTGEEFKASVIAVDVYRYDTILGLSPEKTLEVSDHYPIEMQLKLKSSKLTTEPNRTGSQPKSSKRKPELESETKPSKRKADPKPSKKKAESKSEIKPAKRKAKPKPKSSKRKADDEDEDTEPKQKRSKR